MGTHISPKNDRIFELQESIKNMLHYNKTGSGDPVLLVHGFPNDGSSWDKLLPLLSSNYQYIVPDLPGAGKSAALPELSLEKMAGSILDVLEKEGIDKAILVGHSMGGYTIMEAAQHFPERIKGIALVHSLASADTEEKRAIRERSIKLLQSGGSGKSVFLKAMAENLFAEAFKEKYPRAVDEVANKGMALSADSLSAFYKAIMLRSDKKDWLSQNTGIPIQWIIGDEDKATPMDEALAQCHLSGVNDVRLYRGVGHMSMMEAPERLARDLNEFFDFVRNRN